MLTLKELIDQLLSVRKLPSLSPVVLMLEQSLDQEEPDIQKISQIMGDDPSITSMVLKLANSVIYGGRRTIATVQDAIVRLGLKEIRKMVFDLSVVKFLLERPGGLIDPINFWEHSIGVAYCMEVIEEMTHTVTADGSQAHVVGLLHDIGRWISATYLPEIYQKVASGETIKKDIIYMERDVIGLDHAQIGAAILERWGLPLNIVHCVRFHHEPEFSLRQEHKMVHLTFLADNICRNNRIGDVGEGITANLKEKDWECIDLSGEKEAFILEELKLRLKYSEVLLSIGGLENKIQSSSNHNGTGK
jgi:putative nucleotidyltransferase with HDIG domain